MDNVDISDDELFDDTKNWDAQYDDKVFVFKVTLNGTSPKIWRRLNMIAHSTIGQLAGFIEAAMGFTGCHLHKFELSHPDHVEAVMVTKSELAHQWAYGPHMMDERKAMIYKYFTLSNRNGTYIYDFGDDWEHSVELEEILDNSDFKLDTMTCVAGEGIAPPENCGGVTGYYRLLGIMNDPLHKEHEEMKDWLKRCCCNGEEFLKQLAVGQFDPAEVRCY